MRYPLLLFFLIIFTTGTAQVKSGKDSLSTKILERDDYSIYDKNPANKPKGSLYVRDKITNSLIEDTSATSILAFYTKLTNQGDSFYIKKDYGQAASLYSLAFKVNGNQGKVKHRYNAACCYSILNKIDDAFEELERIAIKGKYYNYFEISSEKKLENLHSDQRWLRILALIKKNAHAVEEKLNFNSDDQ